MKLIIDTTCPVSGERINGNAARAAAFYTIVLTSVSLLTGNYFLSALLALDFGIRAFGPAWLSLIRLLSVTTVNMFGIAPHPVDAAPKKFAAGLGMVFCLAIGIMQYYHAVIPSLITGTLLLICAFLEGAFAFCLGCIIYTFLRKIFNPVEPTSPGLRE
jgi:hypothetical protein